MSSPLGFATALLLCAGPSLAIADCDCTIFPFRRNPPCVSQCSAAILHTTSSDRLQSIVGLSPAVVSKVEKIRAEQPQASLAEFKSQMTTAEKKELEVHLDSLSTIKVKQLEVAKTKD